MILVAVTTIFWVSTMNKLYYGCYFCYVTILFSSNKLLKLKYINYLFFFLKFLMKIIAVCPMGQEIRYFITLICDYILAVVSYRMINLEFESQQGHKIFLFSEMS